MERARLASDHSVDLPPAAAQDRVRAALGSLGYRITVAGPGTVQAQRGHTLRSAVGAADRLLRTTATVTGTTAAARLQLVTEPVTPVHGNASPAVLGAEIDDMLTVHRAVADELADGRPAVILVPVRERAAYEAVLGQPAVARRIRGQVRLLPAGSAVPSHGVVPVAGPGGVTSVTGHKLQEILGMGSYIGGHGDVLSGAEHRDLMDLTAGLWAVVQGIRAGIRLGESLARLADVVERQTRIRASAAGRRVLRCRDCHFDKVVNPEYGRITRRGRRLRNAIGVGTAMIMPFATPATVGARVLAGLTFEPDYVCPRCQGLEADERPAAICPRCGQLRKEVILRHCPNDACRHDFVAALGDPRPFLLLDPPVRTTRTPGKEPVP